MKPVLQLTTILLLSGVVCTVADTVELNGLTSLFGEDMAFLVLRQTGHSTPVSFALSRGQSQFGIKLLAVSVADHSATIDQDGATMFLRISSTLEESTWVKSVPDTGQYHLPRPLKAEEQLQVNHFVSEDPDAQRIKTGNPVVNVAYVGAPVPADTKSQPVTSNESGTASSSSSGSVTSGTSATITSSSDVSVSSSAGATEDYTKEYWYKASMAIEQNRLATADQVINGEMDPLPRTPLTPSHTPAGLFGPVTYFSNHIPGFVCGGSVDN